MMIKYKKSVIRNKVKSRSFSGSKVQTPAKLKYYTEIAEKFGQITRNQLINKYKNINHKPKLNTQYLQNIVSNVNPNPQEQTRYPVKSMICSRQDFYKSKQQMINKFKKQLKRKIQKNLEQEQINNQRKVNQVRWKRQSAEESKRIKNQSYQINKQKQINILKTALQKSRVQHERKKRQIQLQLTFNCWQRRLRPSTNKL